MDTVRIIERMQRTLSELMKIQGSVIRVSCSIGIGFYVFDKSLETSKMLNDADSTIDKLKVRAGGSYSFYDHQLINLRKLFLARTQGTYLVQFFPIDYLLPSPELIRPFPFPQKIHHIFLLE